MPEGHSDESDLPLQLPTESTSELAYDNVRLLVEDVDEDIVIVEEDLDVDEESLSIPPKEEITFMKEVDPLSAIDSELDDQVVVESEEETQKK